MNLGDTADSFPGFLPQEECFTRVTGVLRESGLRFFTLLGNHDTATPKRLAVPLCGMPDRYYSFDAGSHLCLFLDASMNSETEPYPAGMIDWKNCSLDSGQLRWLEETLRNAEKPVCVFCHPCFALKAGWAEELHLIRNRGAAMDLFVKSGKVAAVFCGHYHPGDLQTAGGIPYVTLAAMCEGEQNTYAVVTAEGFELTVEGRGGQPSLKLRRTLPEKISEVQK